MRIALRPDGALGVKPINRLYPHASPLERLSRLYELCVNDSQRRKLNRNIRHTCGNGRKTILRNNSACGIGPIVRVVNIEMKKRSFRNAIEAKGAVAIC